MTGLLSILFQNPLAFTVIAVALLFSVTIHEFSHAWVANRLGDPTAKNLGRLSLNPLAHIDPLGAITLLVVGFGWGKPVPVNYYNFKNPKRDSALVSLAGPASNFLLAAVMALIALPLANLLAVPDTGVRLPMLSLVARAFIYPIVLYNLFLGVFNLLPIEPLDGFKIVNGLLPPRLSVQWVQLAPYGIFILLALVFTNTISRIISPIVNLLLGILGF